MNKTKRVLVNLKTKQVKRGKVILVTARPKVYDIVVEYGDGRVRTSVGDVWHVKPSGKNDYDYVIDEAAEG